MSNDPGTAISRATITLLKNEGDITAIVANRVYPLQAPANPTWPLVTMGSPTITPFKASCLDGVVSRFAIHGWAKTNQTRSGESQCHAIMAAISGVIDGRDGVTLDTAFPATADYAWISTQVIQDSSEAGTFHGIGLVEVSVSS